MGSWPEGVPLPPTPEKPEGIADWEWDLYLDDDPTKHAVLRSTYPHLREKVERAMGWKDDDVADAREIAERVLGAVRIADDGPPLKPAAGKGHVPEENLPRYTRLRELSHLMSRMGNMVSGLGEYDDANTLWAMGGKYKRLANELRAPLPHPRGGLTNNPHEEKP